MIAESFGKHIKVSSDRDVYFLSPEEFLSLNESINPRFAHGCNNPAFNDNKFYNDTKFLQTFIKIHDMVFLLSFGGGVLKFAIVVEPLESDRIMDLILKANVRKTKNVSYSIAAELFNTVLGVIISYINKYNPESVSFSGLTIAHTKLYMRAANNKQFKSIFKEIGYNVTVNNEEIKIEKE
jgi:hypothetical protein